MQLITTLLVLTAVISSNTLARPIDYAALGGDSLQVEDVTHLERDLESRHRPLNQNRVEVVVPVAGSVDDQEGQQRRDLETRHRPLNPNRVGAVVPVAGSVDSGEGQQRRDLESRHRPLNPNQVGVVVSAGFPSLSQEE
ncbi:hypothetical protein HDU98_004202 [Podochytrium sp. JEL0797]|nr:hypothetical protein HDU98_004202 [Podochytrium sp. JEL0797]